jgi:RNA polymerase sigma-70 factor (ECF subfamily)
MEQELSAHAAWVRALARSLVCDDASADDLAQDTWLAALRHPAREGTSMRAWLGSVVRRIAWKRQRDARTAQTRTSAELHTQGAEGPELLERLERLELHEVLAAELRNLREPLRTTLIERFFYGRSAAEIAERTGVPAPTVRWRLQQGLEELRARLDARFGGKRETWMSALAFALPSKGTVLGGSGIAIGEGVLMSTLMKVSIGAVVLVVAVMLALPFVTSDDVPVHVPALSNTPAQPLEAPPDVPRNPNESLAAESAGPERAAVSTEAKPPPAAPAERQTQVVAHIVDENLRPIANAWLRREGREGDPAREDSGNEVRTGNDGIATLRWQGELPRYDVSFEAGADGFATASSSGSVKESATLDLGDLLLHPGGAVRGRVVDAEQHPISGAEVVVASGHDASNVVDVELLRNRGPSTSGRARSGTSATDGSFLIAGVAVGTTRVWAKSGNLRWAVSAPIEIAVGREAGEVVLVIEPENATDPELADIEGVVLGPDGKPIAKPCIYASQTTRLSSWGNRVIGDEDGKFRVQPKERGVKIELEVSDPDDRYTHAKLADVKPGTKGLAVRLEEAKTLVLAVTDEHGPVERFRVQWGPNEWPNGGLLVKDEPHPGGRVEVRVPSDSFWYHVQAPGHRSEKLGPVDGRSPPATLALEMHVIPGVRGRVLDGDRPVSGAKLSLCEQPLNYRCSGDGFVMLVNISNVVEATSSEDGSFVLDLQKDGRFSVLVDAAGFARAQFGPVELRAAKGLSDVVIQLDAGGTLEGTVRMAPGHSAAGVIVGINRGDGKPLLQTVGQDGLFRFEHLTAGSWEIQRAQPTGATSFTTFSSENGAPKTLTLRQDFTIAVGQTTRRDLDLRDEVPSVFEIDLQNNAAPAHAWTIDAVPKNLAAGWGALPSAVTDSNGHARLEIPFVGECRLTITPPAESASAFQFRAEVTLRGGPNSWTQDIKTGRIEGVISDWKPGAGVEWHIKSEAEHFDHVLRPDAGGKFIEPLVGIGKVAVLRTQRGGLDLSPVTAQAFELAAGQTKTIQLP